jgi:lipoprotein-anchoring transpeptidase ErfK/SrfK
MGWRKATAAAQAAVNPFVMNHRRRNYCLIAGGLVLGFIGMAVVRQMFGGASAPNNAPDAAPVTAMLTAPRDTPAPDAPPTAKLVSPPERTAPPAKIVENKPPQPAAREPVALVARGELLPVPETAKAEKAASGAAEGGTALFETARRADEQAKGDLAAQERARDLYQKALETGQLSGEAETQCLARLTDLASKLLLDPKTPCTKPKAVFHTVAQGDNVEKLAKKYHVNQGQVKAINRLNNKLIVRYGQVLKMLPGDVIFKVDREHLHGTLYLDGVFLRRYPVGIGSGNRTPAGTYDIETKVVNPDWYYDNKKIPFGSPANILGTRWLGFAPVAAGQDAGLGIHGTTDPKSVPGRESKGCVRMHNASVEELYDLMPLGGKVVIE